MEKPKFEISGLIDNLEIINQKEPEAVEALSLIIEQIAGTYQDKYSKGLEVIDTKTMLYGKDGAILNTYQIARYLQRYNTQGSEKSGLVKDLLKCVHYVVFEITRRLKTDHKVNKIFIEPKH